MEPDRGDAGEPNGGSLRRFGGRGFPGESIIGGSYAARARADVALTVTALSHFVPGTARRNRSAPRAADFQSMRTGRPANTTCHTPWDVELTINASGFVRAVLVDLQRGGTGNKLFAIAAGIALSDTLHLPIVFPRKLTFTMAARGFPCLRTSEVLRNIHPNRIDLVRPNMMFGINQQDIAVWGTPEPSPRPKRSRATAWLQLMRRSFRPMAAGFKLAQAPAPDDLVLHFRDLRDGEWRVSTSADRQRAAAGARKTRPGTDGDGAGNGTADKLIFGLTRSTYRVGSKQRPWFYNLDLYAPPSAFYDAAIEIHLESHGDAIIWIVCLSHDRNHPTVLALLARWKLRLRFLTKHGELEICGREPSCKVPAILDFLWMQEARHIVLSPSTFGWWSAFLSERATTIHYPVLPQFSPWGPTMWCHLIPEDDERYIFHDPWALETWRGGGQTGQSARRRCDVYMRACTAVHACPVDAERAAAARAVLPLDAIDEFVTYVDDGHELDGLTTAELDSASKRYNLSTVADSPDRRAMLLEVIRTSVVAEAVRKEARAYLVSQNRAPRERQRRATPAA